MNWKFWKFGCQHTFTQWRIVQQYSSEKAGIVKHIQSRTCSQCGFTELNTQIGGD